MNSSPLRLASGRAKARQKKLTMFGVAQCVFDDQRGHSSQALKQLSRVVKPAQMSVAGDEPSVWAREIRR